MNQAQPFSQDKSFLSFPTTHWTTLLQPIHQRTEQAQAALNRLFEIYRKPMVNYVATMTRNPHHAEDIAQDFIVKMLTREDLEKADRTKGQFRWYLCTSIKHHVISHYAAEDARKRKALLNATWIDQAPTEPGHPNDAEKEFTRQWWRATIDEAVKRLRAEWDIAGKVTLFNDLEPLLWDRKDGLSVNAIARKHQITPNAVSLRKLRLKDRLKELLLAVIGETVGTLDEVQEEIRLLLQDP